MTALDAVIQSSADYQKVIPFDSCIVITDGEGKIVKFLSAKTFAMKMNVGDVVSSQGSTAECIRMKKEVAMLLPKELYGVPIKATCIPIFEDGVVVGTLGFGISLATQQTLHDAAQTIAATSEQLTATAQELAANAQQLARNLDSVRKGSDQIATEIKKTDEILNFVSQVAANSNLLGLNAAIEAARAGEHGRGFAVVAEEIRKMATNSEQAVKDIYGILRTIQNETDAVDKTVRETAELGERQATATEEISASMQQLASAATDVEQISEVV